MGRNTSDAMNGKNNSAGYSIIELCIALTVSLIMMAIAVPVVQQTTSLYRLNGAVDSITAAAAFKTTS
jgi:Tfp pilus assembly protein FimT